MFAVAVTFVFWSLPLWVVSTVTSGCTTIRFNSVWLWLLLLSVGPVDMDDDDDFHDCGSSVMVVSDGSLFEMFTCLWWWWGLLHGANRDDDRLFRTTVLLERLCRCVGGDGVDIRSACSSGTSSAAGPIRLSKIGKKNSPLITPIIMTAKRSQKKCRTINSNGDVYSITTARIDVKVPWMTGGRALCRAKRIRRSRLPTDVTKPFKLKTEC